MAGVRQLLTIQLLARDLRFLGLLKHDVYWPHQIHQLRQPHSSMGDTKLQYRRQLNASISEIRILHLSRGLWDADDRLHGKLHFVSLEGKPRFEALSYTWGPAATGHQIIRFVDDQHDFPVTENLFAAFKRLRRRFTSRTLNRCGPH
jgi:hypothetical protein